MSIATDILSLRRDRSSSVETLLGLMDWEHQAWEPDHRTSRHYAVEQAADTVLMAVAVHAAEAERDLIIPPGTRRAVAGSRRFRACHRAQSGRVPGFETRSAAHDRDD